jgi:hypothetical protein
VQSAITWSFQYTRQELFGIRTAVDRPKFLAALKMPTDDPIADINGG